MKVGQLLSARPDLLPAVWIDELTKLQDAAPPIPFEVVRGVLEEDFGSSIAELFESFDERPLAAASIGQVHRAVTKDGTAVADQDPAPRNRGSRPHGSGSCSRCSSGASRRLQLPETGLRHDHQRGSDRRSLPKSTTSRKPATATASAFFERPHRHCRSSSHHGSFAPTTCLTTSFVQGEKITNGARTHSTPVQKPVTERRIGSSRRHPRQPPRSVSPASAASGRLPSRPTSGKPPRHAGRNRRHLGFRMPRRSSNPKLDDRYLALGAVASRLATVTAMATLFTEIGFTTRSGRPDTLHLFTDALLGEIREATQWAVG